MILSCSIMGHPSREKFFSYLRQSLPTAPMSVDDGRGIWENCKRAWQLHDPASIYHVVVQDDAIICKDFQSLAESFISDYIFQPDMEGHPLPAINFYFGNRQQFKKEATKGLESGVVIKSRPVWGVAICLPTALIPEMIEACDEMRGIPEDDVRISRYLLKKKIPVYFPMPSLIDHRHDEPSLVGDPGEFRKAWYFIDNQ